jgi:hypothetical protein
MRAITCAVGVCLLGAITCLCGLGMAATLAMPASSTATGSPVVDASSIPQALAAVYEDASSRYCDGLPWEVLAGIGWVESRHGGGDFDPSTGEMNRTILGPPLDGSGGTISLRDPRSADGWAHAEGPMQFLPSTWRRWGTLAPGRPAGAEHSPHNIWDAIHSTARMLCGGSARVTDLRRAIYRYNHDWDYVDAVLAKADDYRATPATSGPTPDPGLARTGA